MKANTWSVGSAVLIGLLLVAGCTTQPRRVDCEAHLVPINAPTPKAAVSRDGKDARSGSATGEAAP